MTAHVTHGLSKAARNLHWLLANLVEEVPGLLSVAVVSSDGLLLLSSDPARNAYSMPDARNGGTKATAAASAGSAGPAGRNPGGSRAAFAGSAADLATIVSGLGSLTLAAAKVMDTGKVKQTVVTMRDGNLCVMAISDGSLLGVHATPECDMSIVAYQMAFFVSRAGHVLTPELRSELRQSLERASPEQQPHAHPSRPHDARPHDVRGHDARQRDAEGHDVREHDARQRDAEGHDVREHDARPHDVREHWPQEQELREHQPWEHEPMAGGRSAVGRASGERTAAGPTGSPR